jgi:hypothetical protein
MSKKQKSKEGRDVTQLSFRLWAPYSEWVSEQAKAAGIKPTQLARLATMAMVDSGLLSQSERLQRIEDELIRLRKDFNEAVR